MSPQEYLQITKTSLHLIKSENIFRKSIMWLCFFKVFLYVERWQKSLFKELGMIKQNRILCGDNIICQAGKNTLTFKALFHLLLFTWFISRQHSISQMPALVFCLLAFGLSKLNYCGYQQGNAVFLWNSGRSFSKWYWSWFLNLNFNLLSVPIIFPWRKNYKLHYGQQTCTRG